MVFRLTATREHCKITNCVAAEEALTLVPWSPCRKNKTKQIKGFLYDTITITNTGVKTETNK